nr:GGDEF domain-containing protein [Candidatus Krumholzibacteria bacterium]
MKTLLTNGLPLDRVGPHLRHAARRAVRSGDGERMRIVAKVLVAELMRRGDLLRVAVQNDDPTLPTPHYVLIKGTTQLIDLAALGPSVQSLNLGLPPAGRQTPVAKKTAPENPSPEMDGLNSMLLAMEDAQQLDVSDPRSRESGTILGSILALLAKFTPQFDLHIMVFEETYVSEPRHQVFSRNDQEMRPTWLKSRTPGQSVYMDGPRELPQAIRNRLEADRTVSGAVAVPLFGPAPSGTPLFERQEAGMLFLLAHETWAKDTLLRLASRLSRFVTHRWQQHTEMTKLVHIDALTGLFNRGFFDSQFELLLERSRRGNAPLTLILGDIDHFSRVNNDYNHTVGDQALKMVARRLQEELRRIDMIYRVGGEEFALILPNTDLEAAKEVQQRLLDAPMIQHLDSMGNPIDLPITLSYGAVTFPHSGNDAFELYRKADTLLFLSKDRGRNQCHFWSSDGNHAQLLPEVD